jgi:hypothetical protein
MQCVCPILSSVIFPDLQYFSTLSDNRHDFVEKKFLNVKRVFGFSL